MGRIASVSRLVREYGGREAAARIIDRIFRPAGISLGSYLSSPSDQGPQKGGGVDSVFDAIYRSNHWGSSESASGVGSELSFTSDYSIQLVDLIRKMNFRSMFDAPCGDLNWMRDVQSQAKIAYIGGDVSEIALTSARNRAPELDVRLFDICADTFPAVDVWHCRDCLFHLSFGDIRRALENYLKSEIPYAIITTHKSTLLKNNDVETGGFRLLDLERHPISLPRPISYMKDFRKGKDFPRYVGLWSKSQIATAITL